MTKISRLEEYYVSIGLIPELRSQYIEYARGILAHRVPVIFEFGDLAELLGRTTGYLAFAVNAPRSHYRIFDIPKRRGGKRRIAAPYPALLDCQRWINSNILGKCRLHRCCHGFNPKKSIKTNALVHVGQDEILKIDIRDFFPSIKIERVISVFRNFGYSPDVSFYLASLCCLDRRLPQGAGTSPLLSNIIVRRLDSRLYGLARKSGFRYSRYADDITFSGTKIPSFFLGLVTRVLQEEGFEVQESKTRWLREGSRKIVTGINVSGDRLSVPREFKREVRRDVHFILTRGYLDHLNNRKIRNPFYIDALCGKLSFWEWIEPEDPFVLRTRDEIFRIKTRVGQVRN